MIKLWVRLFIFIVTIGSLCFATLHIYPDYKTEYVAGIVPKLNKLKKVKERKIVIVGGSNAAFGIDSDLMERELGIPVVNMALHGGLPLSYILEQVKPFTKKGDILILSREYDGLVGDNRWAHMVGTELPKVITYDTSGLRILLSSQNFFQSTVSSIFETLKLYIKTYPKKSSVDKTSVYSIHAFKNDNLFSSFLQGTYEVKVEEHTLPKPAISSQIINGLIENREHFNNKGIDFYITPPLIVKGFYKTEDIESFWQFMKESTKIPMLNEKKMYTYDKDNFLNSHYHSNVVGREKRTISIINDIKGKDSVDVKQRKVNSIYVSDHMTHSYASLSDFNSIHNFKIIYRDSNEIEVAQSGDLKHNYFRMSFKNKDYKGYSFYMQLEIDKDLIDEIKFRGTGELLNFDTIIPLGTNNYGLWKEMDKVLWTDNNSYFGISFPNNQILKDAHFRVKNIGLYKYLKESDSIVDNYNVTYNKQKQILFEVKSNNEKIKLDEITDTKQVKSDAQLKSDQLYKVGYSQNRTIIKDFYTGEVVFETKNDFSFKKASGNLIHLYEH